MQFYLFGGFPCFQGKIQTFSADKELIPLSDLNRKLLLSQALPEIYSFFRCRVSRTVTLKWKNKASLALFFLQSKLDGGGTFCSFFLVKGVISGARTCSAKNLCNAWKWVSLLLWGREIAAVLLLVVLPTLSIRHCTASLCVQLINQSGEDECSCKAADKWTCFKRNKVSCAGKKV